MQRININTKHINIRERLNSFLESCRNAALEVKLLDPLPQLITQTGYTCGYVALSTCTSFWSQFDPNQEFHPARKRDMRSPWTDYIGFSLRSQRDNIPVKTNYTELGAILDVNYFYYILGNTNYTVSALQFNSALELGELVKSSIQKNLPSVFPLDFSNNRPVLNGGQDAHYVNIVGYVKTQSQIIGCLYVSYGEYYYSSLDLLFQSSNNLQSLYGSYFEKGKDWNEVQLCSPKTLITETTPLDQLRNRFILVYPQPYFRKSMEFTSDFECIKQKIQNLSIELRKHFIKDNYALEIGYQKTTLRVKTKLSHQEMANKVKFLHSINLKAKMICYHSIFQRDEIEINETFSDLFSKLMRIMLNNYVLAENAPPQAMVIN